MATVKIAIKEVEKGVNKGLSFPSKVHHFEGKKSGGESVAIRLGSDGTVTQEGVLKDGQVVLSEKTFRRQRYDAVKGDWTKYIMDSINVVSVSEGDTKTLRELRDNCAQTESRAMIAAYEKAEKTPDMDASIIKEAYHAKGLLLQKKGKIMVTQAKKLGVKSLAGSGSKGPTKAELESQLNEMRAMMAQLIKAQATAIVPAA